ncbi:MAG: DUF2933 domain-containing protein [Caldimonas sp.]
MNHDHSQRDVHPQAFWGSRYSGGLIVLGAVALYFLLTEHRAHFFFALPFLLLLACPLMHIFMHHGHGGHGGGEDRPVDGARTAEAAPPFKSPDGGVP